MTKKTRTVLFLICLFLFLLIAPSVVFYSQGYRIDIDSKKITQTGGLFLKVWPKQTEIYINGKLVKKTDFFFGSALIENLLPKKYKIEVKKEGFHSWEKNLGIKEREVTRAKNIVLFPKNPRFNALTKDIENLWFSPDGKKIIFYEKDERGWALKLFDLEKNVKSHLISETEIYSKGADLMDLEFSEGSKEIFLEVGLKEQIKYYRLPLDKLPVSLTEGKAPEVPESIVTSQKFNEKIYYLEKSGYLFEGETKISEKPFPVKAETEYKLEVFDGWIFLIEEKVAYLFNQDSKIFEKFFEGINSLKISPDFKKLVFFSDSEIWILFLKEKLDPPQKKAGEKLFIVRLSEKIGNIFWLNSDYLIFSSGDNLKIVEIDERDRIQTWEMGNFPNPKIYFNAGNKKLYILSEGNLFASERLY